MQSSDWNEVKNIYLEGIITQNAAFQTDAPAWQEWNKTHLTTCRFVALSTQIVGWAMLSPISNRCVYSGVAEVSIYVSKCNQNRGVGSLLLSKVISESEKNEIWTLEAGIFPENSASLALHKKLGFREIGFREKLGQLNGVWRDVILLERRSKLF